MKKLDTKYFEQNKYWVEYWTLVTKHKEKQIDSIQHKHHIIPKAYFSLVKLPIDNSADNIAWLTPMEHAIAHYYLALCTKAELMYKMRSCFIRMTGNDRFTKKLDLDSLQKLNQIKAEFGEERSRRMKGKKLSEKQKLLISEQSKKRWQDPNYKQNYIEKMTIYYKNRSEEARKQRSIKISKAKKGTKCDFRTKESILKYKQTMDKKRELGLLKVSEETKHKISKALLGHKVSDETKKKISLAGLGKLSWNAKSVICIETGIEYPSARAAELALNLPVDSVRRCCKQKQEQVSGWHWKYKSN